jgi:predicted glycosyltransferase
MRVLIVVTHLLGTGHLRRALMLARTFAQAGHEVAVASGGLPLPHADTRGVELIQLPPLQSDGINFTTLLSADGTPADTMYLANRIKAVQDALSQTTPDVLITELFPFGRRVLTDEFTALLEQAKSQEPKPLILCSIRDILAPPSKPSKAMRTDAIIARYYDAVLVHSDPQATALDVSWPVSDVLKSKLKYTGYVAPVAPTDHPDNAGTDEVLVSAGGGGVGTSLFECAIATAARSPDLNWRILVGGVDTDSRVSTLQAQVQSRNIILEPARPDFRQMLRHAACSVSMCGYNTALDILQAGTPALFVPFDDGSEIEQTLRAHSLRSLPGIDMMAEADLSPDILVRKLHHLIATPRRDTVALSFDGAEETVRIAQAMQGERT